MRHDREDDGELHIQVSAALDRYWCSRSRAVTRALAGDLNGAFPILRRLGLVWWEHRGVVMVEREGGRCAAKGT